MAAFIIYVFDRPIDYAIMQNQDYGSSFVVNNLKFGQQEAGRCDIQMSLLKGW